MIASEAIKMLEIQKPAYGCKEYQKPLMYAYEMAIKALEKQEKIKEVFTHYAFSGNELDVLNDCISALSEIKAILKE